ncbi:MAG: S-layer family protein [Nostoc sp. NMS1]|uniref:beta strand repeat-containing protein n=1 Tax=unclassified Nostoc TaxID=2593658 RepID=UPI0025E092E2|nr:MULTISPECIES: S-layer family protein [unclassified Nostoc]MBN3905585.1 S-layer family protein [Nostoc sp. NMS1]MBN3992469.1 S-layer family protein [Nostoc sp. NMS2]
MSRTTRYWRHWDWKLSIAIWLAMNGAIASSINCASAQITPDGTLPNNSSVTTINDINIIEGGSQAGKNLFHSFQKFSVPTGGTAFFNNAAGIQNIISRVTGGSASNIDGLIRANGTANLFLINSNGIIFGPKASLDVKGSFVATTASSLKFADGKEFSTTTPQTTPLLTVSVPIGLQFGETPKSIINQSQATNSNGEPVGLQVRPGKTLALVGGDITLAGGQMTVSGGTSAAGGRIELGSVAGNNLVRLNPTNKGWALGYEGIENFLDIKLSQLAVINANGNGSGDIQLQGRDVNITDGSQIQANTLGSKPGGTLIVTATESVNVIGTSADTTEPSRLTAQTSGDGTAGALAITTKKLILRDGGEISTTATSRNKNGTAGNLTIRASESVELMGETIRETPEKTYQSRLITNTYGRGSAGDLNITTGKLIIKDGGQVFAGTQPRSMGSGGNLTISADSVEVIGTSSDRRSIDTTEVSRITNQTSGARRAKTLTITTRKLSIRDGGLISAAAVSRSSDPNNLSFGQGGSLNINASDSVEVIGGLANAVEKRSRLTTRTEGAGKAGDLTITTGKLIILDGAQVSAGTTYLSRGQGGDLTVNASDSVQVIGESLYGEEVYSRLTNRTAGNGDAGNSTINTKKLIIQNGGQVSSDTLEDGLGGTLNVNASDFIEVSGRSKPTSELKNGFASRLSATTSGAKAAGNLNITTPILIVQNGAEITVSGRGTGNAGDLAIASDKIRLENQGKLLATTTSGEGGNIKLTIADFIQMRRNSQISATAGIAGAGGNGGNITINDPDNRRGFVVAAPLENNDIIANAFNGQGGKVQINATAIFGMTVRSREDLVRLFGTSNLDPQRLQTSDITAISQTSPTLNGQVIINTADVDPNRGLVNLPSVVVDTQLAQGCSAGSSQVQSKFVITGRGGLPPNPGEALSTDAVQVDLVTLKPEVNKPSTPAVSTNPTSSTPARIVEANSWVIAANGDVILTANAYTLTPHSSWQRTADCRVFNQQQGG